MNCTERSRLYCFILKGIERVLFLCHHGLGILTCFILKGIESSSHPQFLSSLLLSVSSSKELKDSTPILSRYKARDFVSSSKELKDVFTEVLSDVFSY